MSKAQISEARALEFELSAAEILIEQVKAISEEGDTLLADTVEGQTNILELIAAVDSSILDDDTYVAGIKLAVEKLNARKARIEGRAEMKRAVLANALDLIGKRSFETPTGTISLRDKPITAIVTDEASVPARFWKAQAPTLDKAALNAAIRAKEDVPGATISNPGFSLSIRR